MQERGLLEEWLSRSLSTITTETKCVWEDVAIKHVLFLVIIQYKLNYCILMVTFIEHEGRLNLPFLF